jgi:plastocyanin
MRAPFLFAFLGLLAVVAMTACGGPASASTPPASAPAAATQAQPSASVSMTDANQFQPVTLTVSAGTTVTWTNSGSVQHTVTDDPSKAVNAADATLPSGAPAWDSGPVNGGQTFSQTFTTPGTYKYFCIPHESLGMVATITVN